MNYRQFDRFFATLATAGVLAGVVAGFWVLGTPGQQRSLSGDRQRLEDLSAIANSIYWQSQDQPDYRLPESLPPAVQRQDPMTQESYPHSPLSDSRYQLCATFATDSESNRLMTADEPFWQHTAGEQCFEFDLSQPPPGIF